MSATTTIQGYQQAEGPHRPTARILAAMIDGIPFHNEVRAISINGQTGTIVIETYHEGLEQQYTFSTTATP